MNSTDQVSARSAPGSFRKGYGKEETDEKSSSADSRSEEGNVDERTSHNSFALPKDVDHINTSDLKHDSFP